MYSPRSHSMMELKHRQRRRKDKGPGRARGRQSRHKGTWMLKSSFTFLRVREWPLPTLFWADKRLAKKAFDCGVEDWVLCAIQGKLKGWVAREVRSAAGTDFSGRVRGCSGKQRRAGQGAPGPLHDSSLHQQAGLTGWGSQQGISHSGLIWGQNGSSRLHDLSTIFNNKEKEHSTKVGSCCVPTT